MDAFQVNIINARVRLQTVYVALSFFTQTYPCFLLLYAVYRPAIHIKSNELFFLHVPKLDSFFIQREVAEVRAWCSAVLGGCRHGIVLAVWRLMRSADAFGAAVIAVCFWDCWTRL